MIRKKKSKISYFSKGIFAANILAALMLLISYTASITDPQIFWPIAFFGLAYPAFFIINILFIIYWLFVSPKFALLSLVCILTGYKFVTSHIGFRESTAIAVPKSSANFLRLMTYNVHNFKKFGATNDEFTKDQILNIIRQEQPDILCIQEFFTRKKGDYNFIKLIKEIMETNYYYFEPNTDNGYETIGLAIFSKFPIKNKGVIRFKNTHGNEALFADIEFNKEPVRIYNVHFQSINFKPEDYKYIKEITKERDVESSRRIGSRLKRAFLKRSEQVKVLKEHTKNNSIPYMVAGDFNDTPVSYTVNSMAEGLKNCFREKGSGFGITYNGAFPNFQIDYILVSKTIDVKNYLIIDKKISDHYAVRSDLEF